MLDSICLKKEGKGGRTKAINIGTKIEKQRNAIIFAKTSRNEYGILTRGGVQITELTLDNVIRAKPNALICT